MDTLHRLCAGLDVHKDSVWVCIRRLRPDDQVTQDIRSFGTMTADLLDLLAWLVAAGVPIVAMESTGVYGKPVFNILEGHVRVLLVNAEQVQQVEGRKTDAADCAWLAQLLQHGLLRPNFVPPAPIRELRDLTRQRTQLVGERSAAANRVQKVLEDANIKLGSVATDVLGVSGRAMLAALLAGRSDPEKLAERARGRLRAKIPALQRALRGRVTEHHRFLLRLHLDHLNHLDELIDRLTARVAELLGPVPDPPAPAGASGAAEGSAAGAAASSAAVEPAANPLGEAVRRLTTIPGVSRRTAEVVVAEIGADRGQFATAGHVASWAGLCPGNHQSAGKRHSGRVRRGNLWLKQALVQAAWAATRRGGGALSAEYRRLAQRRGKKRALLALAPTLLVTCYYLLKRGTTYQEPERPQDQQTSPPPAEGAA